MNRVAIKNNGKETLFLPLDEDGTLSLDTLRIYLPNANGLVYTDGIEKVGLLIKNQKIFINPSVQFYEVHNASNALANSHITSDDSQLKGSQRSNESTIVDSLEKMKELRREQVMTYRKAIELADVDEEKKKSVPKVKISNFKNKDIRNLHPSKVKTKVIYIGWKHRYKMTDKHLHKKNIGHRQLVLDRSKIYFVQDIINEGIKLFTEESFQKIFKNSDLDGLGFNNGNFIKNFELPDGNDVGIFEYYEFNNIASSRINLYLYTTTKRDYEVRDESDTDSDLSEDGLREVVEMGTCMGMNTKRFQEKLKKKKKQKFLIESLNTKAAVEDVPNDIPKLAGNVQTADKDSYLKNSFGIEKDKMSESTEQVMDKENNFDARSVNFSNDHFNSFDTVKDYQSSKDCNDFDRNLIEVTIENTFDLIEVTYLSYSTSKYSNELSYSHNNKFGALTQMMTSDPTLGIDVDNLHGCEPVDYGLEISQIEVNGVIFFSVSFNENCQKIYTFREYSPSDVHTIVQDIDVIHGYSEGRFGIGIVAKCTHECRPLCSWYCNGRLFKQGVMLFWLSCIPSNMVESTWQCKIKCDNSYEITSKQIKIMHQCPSLKNEIDNVLIVRASDFQLIEMIGGGSQGKVYKAIYKNTTVAVKVLQVYGSRMKLVEKEISVMKSLIHKNFIKIIAVCKEEKKVSILMEFFPGRPLSDLILGGDKNYFNLSLKNKINIILEICKAFCFLHMQENPVLHRDIKLENILINEEGLIKVCDFGISTFSSIVTSLRTTYGRKAAGTLMYFPPEIVLNQKSSTSQKQSTIKSEVWAIACMIVEMFSENPIWDDVLDEEHIKIKFLAKEKPNLSDIPEELVPIMLKCFSYQPEDRPTTFEIFQAIRDYSTIVIAKD